VFGKQNKIFFIEKKLYSTTNVVALTFEVVGLDPEAHS
jgi:hypothetical protein